MSEIVPCHTSKWRYHWRGELFMWHSVFQIYLLHYTNHNMYGISWSINGFVNLCIIWFEEKMMWNFICFGIFIFWINDSFMWIAHETYHTMYESKDGEFCWGIYVATETHDKVLKIVESLNSDVHETTDPAIEESSTWVFNFFSSSPIGGISTKIVF